MAKYINLGEYNKYYKYMIFFIISKALNDCIKGFGNKGLFEDIAFFGDDARRFFTSHELINSIFGYFGIIIFDIIYKYFNDENDINFKDLNYNLAQKKRDYNEYEIYLNAFLITFFWVIGDLLLINKLFNLWTLKILITYIIGKKIFNFPIYKHQIFAIYFISIVCSLLFLIQFILSLLAEEKYEYRKIPGLILIGILISILNLLIESFSNWKYIWLMNLKFTLSNKLFMYFGILGFIIFSLICIITTFFDCDDSILEFCKLEKDKKKYFENVTIYFDDLSTTNCILMIFYVITFVLKSYFYLMTIKHLSPFHIISLPTIYYTIRNIILGIYTYLKYKKLKKGIIIYILQGSSDILAFLAFCIFLEFIELNFCNCNYNLRRNIAERCYTIDNTSNDSILDEEERKSQEYFQNELSLK